MEKQKLKDVKSTLLVHRYGLTLTSTCMITQRNWHNNSSHLSLQCFLNCAVYPSVQRILENINVTSQCSSCLPGAGYPSVQRILENINVTSQSGRPERCCDSVTSWLHPRPLAMRMASNQIAETWNVFWLVHTVYIACKSLLKWQTIWDGNTTPQKTCLSRKLPTCFALLTPSVHICTLRVLSQRNLICH